MQEPKRSNFNDRLSAAAEAKKARLAQFKPKPTITDPEFRSREERRLAEVEAVRAAREAEREAIRKAQAAVQQAGLDAELSELDAKRAERKERKAQLKAEARAKREAKSAERRK